MPISGNMIPKSTFDPTGIGPTILNFFPMPNYFPAAGKSELSISTTSRSLNGGQHPIRNYVGRADVNITSKITGYFRGVVTTDNTYDSVCRFPVHLFAAGFRRACLQLLGCHHLRHQAEPGERIQYG